MTIGVIVCAHNEARYLAACLHSGLAQSRVPDEIVVVNNASTDETSIVARQIPHVCVVDEPRKGLVVARETGGLRLTLAQAQRLGALDRALCSAVLETLVKRDS